MDSYKLFINGEFVDARSGDTFESVDPGSGAVIAQVAKAGTGDAEDAIGAARRAFDQGEWSALARDVRARRCYEFADQVAAETLRLALMESMDSGQVIGLSKFWGMLASGTLRNLGYHAATKFPWEEEIPFSGNYLAPGREYIRREPIGVCVGIIPWNFPIAMASWKIAHAIVMGKTIVLKHASLEAGAAHADHGAHHGRGRAGCRHPPGCDQRHSRIGRRTGGDALHPSRRRQDRVHR